MFCIAFSIIHPNLHIYCVLLFKVNVMMIEQTDLYDNATTFPETLQIMTDTYESDTWQMDNIDLQHALLGKNLGKQFVTV